MIVLMSGSVAGAQQDAASAGVYESDRATVAVVDRDGGEAGIAQGLREGLSAGCDLIALDDTERALQDAVATNYVDLIIIVPEGYAARFAEAVRTGGDVPGGANRDQLHLRRGGDGEDADGRVAVVAPIGIPRAAGACGSRRGRRRRRCWRTACNG